jgi:hypothetical protein
LRRARRTTQREAIRCFAGCSCPRRWLPPSAGFLTSQILEARRPDAAPAVVALEAPEVALPSVSTEPPPAAEMRPQNALPTPPPVAEPTAAATAAPAGDGADAATPPAVAPVVQEAAATEVAAPEPATALEVAPPPVSAAPPAVPARVRRAPPQPRNVEVSVEAEPGASISARKSFRPKARTMVITNDR